uniref:Uncharacterized protein n=2 Tax=Oryza TaxID=4527 RepID=Q6H7B5_ORYSJ|nr:hypothetical protein [Oryza sativa Japonica Group]
MAWETRATARLAGGTQVAAADDTGRLGAAGVLGRRRAKSQGGRATPASLVVAALVEKLGRPCGVDAVPAGTLCAVICGGGCSLVAAVGEVVPMGSSGVLGRRRSEHREPYAKALPCLLALATPSAPFPFSEALLRRVPSSSIIVLQVKVLPRLMGKRQRRFTSRPYWGCRFGEPFHAHV